MNRIVGIFDQNEKNVRSKIEKLIYIYIPKRIRKKGKGNIKKIFKFTQILKY